MQLDLGTKIRQLRRRDGRTQEALADALGVTPQAVSRWEGGGSYPDMNLIPSIANYFGVTIDELFGCTNQRAQRIDQLADRIRGMQRQSNGTDCGIDQCIMSAREALIEFPGNGQLMLCLASALYTAGYVRHGEGHLTDSEGYSIYDTARHRRYPEWKEAISLYEKALPILEGSVLREQAVRELSQLYVNTGASDKALALAESAPPMENAREFLRIRAFDGKRQAQAMGEALLDAVHQCALLMIRATIACQQRLTAAEKSQSIRGAIALFEQVCTDGRCGRHHSLIARMHMLHSLYLWLDGKQDEAFGALAQALTHYKAYEAVCRSGRAVFTAPLVQLVATDLADDILPGPDDPSATAACLPEDWPWWSVPEKEEVKREMQLDPRWDAWAAQAKA